MPIDKVEAIELIKLAVDEIVVALKDAETPGAITKSEWFAIAQKVGLKAFGEFVD